ncbi:hypothetical protein EV426DRAFT_709681 [Tirmania nivea]|nr:hypothetical protein EV426DRAFT_709681 [Tirmania nivea]
MSGDVKTVMQFGVQPPPPSSRSDTPSQAQTLVRHAAPTKYKPRTIRRWIEEEDNKGVGFGGRVVAEGGPAGINSSLVGCLREEPGDCTAADRLEALSHDIL